MWFIELTVIGVTVERNLVQEVKTEEKEESQDRAL